MAETDFIKRAEQIFVGETIKAVKLTEGNSLLIYTEFEVITIDKVVFEDWVILALKDRTIEDTLGGA